jgi:hypothetical protein
MSAVTEGADDAFNSSLKMHSAFSISCGFGVRNWFANSDTSSVAAAGRPSARAEPGACVEIILPGKEIQFCADAQRRIVTIELADSGDVFERARPYGIAIVPDVMLLNTQVDAGPVVESQLAEDCSAKKSLKKRVWVSNFRPKSSLLDRMDRKGPKRQMFSWL